MNDYKELIAKLTAAANRNSNSLNTRDACRKAADTIEQLVKELDELVTKCHRLEKERDAAVDDLRISCDCESCKWFIGGDCTDLEHEECHGEHWKWRGGKEDENETD